jgi:phosphatidylglycerol:prolipoprotein diacylglycerol transferase
MFLHDFYPSPIAFRIGPLNFYWYGLLMVLAIFLGGGSFFWLNKTYKILKEEEVWNLSFYLILSGLIGARLFHLFYNFSYYWQNPLAIFKIWQGGLSIHGALVGGMLALFFYSRFKNLSFWLLADLLAPALALGKTIGRWGNYFNQELYGWPTDLPWAIPIDYFNRVEGFLHFKYFHPTFLYESLWCFSIFLILLIIHRKRIKKLREQKHSNILEHSGFIFLLYLVLYSFGRFLIEFLRIDPQPIFLSLRLGQWLSLIILAKAVFLRKFSYIR